LFGVVAVIIALFHAIVPQGRRRVYSKNEKAKEGIQKYVLQTKTPNLRRRRCE